METTTTTKLLIIDSTQSAAGILPAAWSYVPIGLFLRARSVFNADHALDSSANPANVRGRANTDTTLNGLGVVPLIAGGLGDRSGLKFKASGGRFAGSRQSQADRLPSDGELEVRRLEVDIWEALLRTVPSLVFGDYGIVHPTAVYVPLSGLPIPAPKAKYTLPTRWQVIKGHKPKRGEASQYRKIAKTLVNAPWFRANEYGWGDENIREVATGHRGKKGNNTDWVAYTTQIHLAMTVKQVAVAVLAAAARAEVREET